GSGFYIQVGAYGQADNARRTAQKLRDAGVAHVFTLSPAADQPLQRVRIGPIASVPEYDQLIARLSALGFPAARLAQD
ncbi:MAG TPA: SPOR domain-containing protein, partial [Steroidobacteraceae bacterium]